MLPDRDTELWTGIPLVEHLGIRIRGETATSLTLVLPFAPNRNDKNTAFAGSLYSGLVLAGWGLLSNAAIVGLYLYG